MEVQCTAYYESEVSRIGVAGLVEWLRKLPPNAVAIPQPMVHGKMWIKAEWKEHR